MKAAERNACEIENAFSRRNCHLRSDKIFVEDFDRKSKRNYRPFARFIAVNFAGLVKEKEKEASYRGISHTKREE